jgi:uncharacterized membrane protein
MTNRQPKDQNAAMISYLTIIGALIAMSMNSHEKNTFARFHIRQAFGIHLLYIVTVLVVKDYLDAISYGFILLFYLFLWGHGFWNAIQSKMTLTPFIGSYFQKWFTFIN